MSIRVQSMSTSRAIRAVLRAALLVALIFAGGCAGSAWKKTLSEDTSAGYYRFIRDHGDSKYVEDARERLEFHKLKRNPTLAGFEVFRKEYPNSPLIAELHPALESPAFEAARAQGTVEAYREFLDSFPAGELAARARGNSIYVEAQGFGGNAVALGEFAAEHPASDFAAEAKRTALSASASTDERLERSLRPLIELGARVADVDGVGERAVVLYENGSFDLLGLADPAAPINLATYRRGEDFKKWSEVRVLGTRVAIFGEEGLELVRFSAEGPQAEHTWGRGEIGRVLGIAPMGDQLVVAGAKGMQLLDPATGEIRRIMRRVVTGIAAAGDSLVFTDGESVYVSNLTLLAEERVIAQMKLGRTFGPSNVSVHDHTAMVTGPGGALLIDVRNPLAPKAIAQLSSRQIGEVTDAIRVRGRTFLIGERGALLLDRQLARVEQVFEVEPRERGSVMGRHLVVAGGSGVQVVDPAAWTTSSVPAATTGSAGNSSSLLNGSGF